MLADDIASTSLPFHHDKMQVRDCVELTPWEPIFCFTSAPCSLCQLIKHFIDWLRYFNKTKSFY